MKAELHGLGGQLRIRPVLVRRGLDEARDLGQPSLCHRLLVHPQPERVLVEDLLVDERVDEPRPFLALRRAAEILDERLPHDVEAGRRNDDAGPLGSLESAPEHDTPEQRRPDQRHVERRGAEQLHCWGSYQIGDVQARSWITGCTNGNVVSLLQHDAPRWALNRSCGSVDADIALRSFWHRFRSNGSTPIRSRHQWVL